MPISDCVAKGLLFHLAADLIREKAGIDPLWPISGVVEEFKRNSEGVLDRYAIQSRERQALMTMDRQVIGEWTRAELVRADGPWGGGEALRASLLGLVADLIRDDVCGNTTCQGTGCIPHDRTRLIERLGTDLEGLVRDYHLSQDAITALRTGDRAQIAEFIFREIVTTPAPPPDELWAEPIPEILDVFRLGPPATNRGLLLIATAVLSGAEVHLASKDRLHHIVASAILTQPIEVLDEVLRAEFAESDLAGARNDEYRVMIYNSRNYPPLVFDGFVEVRDGVLLAPDPPPDVEEARRGHREKRKRERRG